MSPVNPRGNFERIKEADVGEFLEAKITAIDYEENHEFTYLGQGTKAPGIRIKFDVPGYEKPKSSGWMKFITGARANYYKIYVTGLVENATPNMVFNCDVLKGLKVKLVFTENDKGFQKITLIKPFDKQKILVKVVEDEGTTTIEEERVKAKKKNPENPVGKGGEAVEDLDKGLVKPDTVNFEDLD